MGSSQTAREQVLPSHFLYDPARAHLGQRPHAWVAVAALPMSDPSAACNACPWRPLQAAFYFTQLLRALVFMHANGFCHRDIKPENCMVRT